MTVPPETGAHAVGAEHAAEGGGSQSTIGQLFGSVTQDLSTLVRQEVALAKAELSQSASRAGKGAGMLGGAAVAGHFVLLFLSVAVWWALGDVIGRGWSAVVVAVVWAVVAAVLAAVGRKEIKEVRGLPRTAETVSKVPSALKGEEAAR